MDEATFLASVCNTIIVEEAWRSVSISAEVSARIMVFYDLDVPYNDYVVRKSRSPCQSSGGSGYSSGK
jgi:pyruvate/2-oxoglutarate/acetoin dehydrogenase E1 component